MIGRAAPVPAASPAHPATKPPAGLCLSLSGTTAGIGEAGNEMSTSTDELAERLDRLETRIAYQDEAIEALNQTITAQWGTIETLRRQVAEIGERLEDAAAALPPVDRPPPHY